MDGARAAEHPYVRTFDGLGIGDVALVGGKNASLGEMIGALSAEGVPVPPGFATTSHAYRDYLEARDLRPRIESLLEDAHGGGRPVDSAGTAIREAILAAPLTDQDVKVLARYYSSLEGLETTVVE